jgi:hypothetical protein
LSAPSAPSALSLSLSLSLFEQVEQVEREQPSALSLSLSLALSRSLFAELEQLEREQPFGAHLNITHSCTRTPPPTPPRDTARALSLTST